MSLFLRKDTPIRNSKIIIFEWCTIHQIFFKNRMTCLIKFVETICNGIVNKLINQQLIWSHAEYTHWVVTIESIRNSSIQLFNESLCCYSGNQLLTTSYNDSIFVVETKKSERNGFVRVNLLVNIRNQNTLAEKVIGINFFHVKFSP